MKDSWNGGLGFGGLLDQSGAVSRLLERRQIAAQRRVRLEQTELAKRVQVRAAAADEIEFREVKQVQLAGKRRFGAACAFGDGAEPAEIGGEPLDDEAGFSKQASAQNQAGGALAHGGVAVWVVGSPASLRSALCF